MCAESLVAFTRVHSIGVCRRLLCFIGVCTVIDTSPMEAQSGKRPRDEAKATIAAAAITRAAGGATVTHLSPCPHDEYVSLMEVSDEGGLVKSKPREKKRLVDTSAAWSLLLKALALPELSKEKHLYNKDQIVPLNPKGNKESTELRQYLRCPCGVSDSRLPELYKLDKLLNHFRTSTHTEGIAKALKGVSFEPAEPLFGTLNIGVFAWFAAIPPPQAVPPFTAHISSEHRQSQLVPALIPSGQHLESDSASVHKAIGSASVPVPLAVAVDCESILPGEPVVPLLACSTSVVPAATVDSDADTTGEGVISLLSDSSRDSDSECDPDSDNAHESNDAVIVGRLQVKVDAIPGECGSFLVLDHSQFRCLVCPKGPVINCGQGTVDGQCSNHAGSTKHKESRRLVLANKKMTSFFPVLRVARDATAVSAVAATKPLTLKMYTCQGFSSSTWVYRVHNKDPETCKECPWLFVTVNPMDLVNDLRHKRAKRQCWTAYPDGDLFNSSPHFRASLPSDEKPTPENLHKRCFVSFEGNSADFDDDVSKQVCPTCRYLFDNGSLRKRLLRYQKSLENGGAVRGARSSVQAGGYMTVMEYQTALKRSQAKVYRLADRLRRTKQRNNNPRGFMKWYSEGSPKVLQRCCVFIHAL